MLSACTGKVLQSRRLVVLLWTHRAHPQYLAGALSISRSELAAVARIQRLAELALGRRRALAGRPTCSTNNRYSKQPCVHPGARGR